MVSGRHQERKTSQGGAMFVRVYVPLKEQFTETMSFNISTSPCRCQVRWNVNTKTENGFVQVALYDWSGLINVVQIDSLRKIDYLSQYIKIVAFNTICWMQQYRFCLYKLQPLNTLSGLFLCFEIIFQASSACLEIDTTLNFPSELGKEENDINVILWWTVP